MSSYDDDPVIWDDYDPEKHVCFCPVPGCEETPICCVCRCCPGHCCSHYGCGPEDPNDLNLGGES